MLQTVYSTDSYIINPASLSNLFLAHRLLTHFAGIPIYYMWYLLDIHLGGTYILKSLKCEENVLFGQASKLNQVCQHFYFWEVT